MTVLELTDVYRAYERGVPVLQGVDLSVAPGEVVGLLGPNGAGKTTLMRVAMGMILPQRGTARLFGADPSQDPVEAKRRVGYVSENQELPPFLRARDVLSMHAELFDRWDPKVANDLMDRFRLTGKEKIRQLSKGQARRVAVVCAIAHRPELLLLDEPAGGLDPAGRREFLEVALKVLGSEGSAILFSSHQMDDVERIAGRVVMLRGGHKLIDRDLDDLREGTSLVAVPGGGRDLVAVFQGTQGCLGSRVTAGEVRGIFEGSPERVREALGSAVNGNARVATTTLEDLFIEVAEGA